MTDQEIAEIFLDHATVDHVGKLVLPRVNALGFARALLAKKEQEIVALNEKLEIYANKASDCALKASKYVDKYVDLLQAVTDPENQPNQYGATVVAVNMSADQEKELIALHAKLAGETLRADQGWQRYEASNKARLAAEHQLASIKEYSK